MSAKQEHLKTEPSPYRHVLSPTHQLGEEKGIKALLDY